MTKTPQLPPSPEAISGDESLHQIARLALAPLGFPFDDLRAEADLLLNQSGLANHFFAEPSEAQAAGRRDTIKTSLAKPERRAT